MKAVLQSALSIATLLVAWRRSDCEPLPTNPSSSNHSAGDRVGWHRRFIQGPIHRIRLFLPDVHGGLARCGQYPRQLFMGGAERGPFQTRDPCPDRFSHAQYERRRVTGRGLGCIRDGVRLRIGREFPGARLPNLMSRGRG